MQDSSQAAWSISLVAIMLSCLVLAVFLPILDFEFIEFDVKGQLLQNPHVQGLDAANVMAIFTSRSLTSYYPVRTLTFAIDHHLWGMNARGFKLANILIHLANTLLVFLLILRLFRHSAEAPGFLC